MIFEEVTVTEYLAGRLADLTGEGCTIVAVVPVTGYEFEGKFTFDEYKVFFRKGPQPYPVGTYVAGRGVWDGGRFVGPA